IHSLFAARRSITGRTRWIDSCGNEIDWQSIAFATWIMPRSVAILLRWCDEFIRTSVGRCPRKQSKGCAGRSQARCRDEMGFIGARAHSSAYKKQRAPLDSEPIATGLV